MQIQIGSNLNVYVVHVCMFDIKIHTIFTQLQAFIEFIMFSYLIERLKHIITVRQVKKFCNNVVVVL